MAITNTHTSIALAPPSSLSPSPHATQSKQWNAVLQYQR